MQLLVAAMAVVPILSGLSGAVLGSDVFGSHVGLSRTGDSHLRYLSGLILAIGLGFWSTVPCIETQGTRFRLLTCLVLAGGLVRLLGLVVLGAPTRGVIGALVMELVVAPGLALWRERLEHRMRCNRPQITSSVLSSVSP